MFIVVSRAENFAAQEAAQLVALAENSFHLNFHSAESSRCPFRFAVARLVDTFLVPCRNTFQLGEFAPRTFNYFGCCLMQVVPRSGTAEWKFSLRAKKHLSQASSVSVPVWSWRVKVGIWIFYQTIFQRTLCESSAALPSAASILSFKGLYHRWKLVFLSMYCLVGSVLMAAGENLEWRVESRIGTYLFPKFGWNLPYILPIW